ncbi:MAG: glycogen/starch synthase [Candidatus Woesearchaeota archaeon]|jgi:glycogen(starch) synthase|nr:glycogen/starch synthase [Candidatus Woesearchaeota archaeon]|tara:strand:+ start:2419 stop:4257 length:1839 start_codon:yes stop_codon:yes gene_type:complete
MREVKPKADFLIELPIALGTGGIHVVVESKSAFMKKYYNNNYLVIGPYDTIRAKAGFEEKKIDDPGIERVFNEMKKEGIICHYGFFLVAGKPTAIMIDTSKYSKKLKEINKEIKLDYGFRVKYNFEYYDSFALFGYATGKLIEKLLKIKKYNNKKGVVHIHEWVSGLALLYIKKHNCNVKTVFTTHATVLGRHIASNKENLYDEIKKNLKENRTARNARAKRYKDTFGYEIYDAHLLEKELVKEADIFTTVSDSVARECKYILGRKPDVITPNGLEMNRFPSLEERAIYHQESKERIYRFLNAYFLPYHPVDIPHSLLFFTSGRYELTTKGYDILFEALAKLNDILKKEDYQNTIFVFLFIMTSAKESNEQILQNLAVYDTIEHAVREELPHLEKRIITSLIHRHEIKREVLFDEHFLIESKKLMLKFKKGKFENPPISAFKGLKKNDIIMKFLLRCGLDNQENDKVKMIFYPAPVSIADGLLSMEYDEVIKGMHLGIFPSLYEPWGYTPLETAANAIMSITSDVSGFGKFILKNSDQRKKPGILVLKTENKKRGEIISELVNMMYWVTKLPRKKRIEKKLEARKLSTLADWKEFAKYYVQAHNLAIGKVTK